MSGGHFNYAQYGIMSLAEDLEGFIEDPNDTYSPETIAEFKKGLELLKKAYVYAQRIDWLVSADDSEATFHERLKSDLAAIDTP